MTSIKENFIYDGKFPPNAPNGHNFHYVVVRKISDKRVYYFCITSQDLSKKYYAMKDKDAIVKLSTDDQYKIFKNIEKESYIYCGDIGLCISTEKEFLNLTRYEIMEVSKDLKSKMDIAIKNSKSLLNSTKKLLL